MVVGICGGDRRNVCLAELLRQHGKEVIAYGIDDIPVRKVDSLKKLVEQSDILVGATPVARFCFPEEKSEDTLEIFLESMKRGDVFFAGAIPEGWQEAFRVRGIESVDFLKGKKAKDDNGCLTAEGLLIVIADRLTGRRNILVTGYGSCGRAIAQKLLLCGHSVTVCVRATHQKELAKQEGMTVCGYEDLAEYAGYADIIINTVPAIVFSENCLKRLSGDVLLVEIASGEGGFDSEAAKKQGILIWSFQGLPGKYFPEQCAQSMLEKILSWEGQCKKRN